VRALSAFVMRLIRTLHGIAPAFAERDRYLLTSEVSSEANQSREKAEIVAPVSAPVADGFGRRTGVQLLTNLSCRVETPSATYAKLSPVDNS
jgi:hypothetical protein